MAIAVLGVPTPARADTYNTELINVVSNLRADVMWASTNPSQGVFLWPDNTSQSQEFLVLKNGGSSFRLQAQHSKQCLRLDPRSGPSYPNGTLVIQYPCDPGYVTSEYWQWRWLGAVTIGGASFNRWVLVNLASGRCLDANNGNGGTPPQQAVLQEWDCVTSINQWNAGNQMWDFRSLSPFPILVN